MNPRDVYKVAVACAVAGWIMVQIPTGVGKEKDDGAGAEVAGRSRMLLYTCFNDGAANYTDPDGRRSPAGAVAVSVTAEQGIAQGEGYPPAVRKPPLQKTDGKALAAAGA